MDINGTVQLIPGTRTWLNGRIRSSEIVGQKLLGAVRGPVGRTISHHGELQQNGEAARVGCEQPS